MCSLNIRKVLVEKLRLTITHFIVSFCYPLSTGKCVRLNRHTFLKLTTEYFYSLSSTSRHFKSCPRKPSTNYRATKESHKVPTQTRTVD